jgi:hypothetical protein
MNYRDVEHIGGGRKRRRYTVYRVLGYDSLFVVNAQSQWEPIKSNDSLYAIMDSFVTKDSVLIDSSVVVGVPYIYVVIATKSDGSRSDVKLTYPPALSAYSIKIDAPSASAIRNLSHREAGFTMITLQWNRPLVVKSAGPVYTVCRIHGSGRTVQPPAMIRPPFEGLCSP